MPNSIKPLVCACFLATATLASSLPAQAQGGPGDIGAQMARNVGAMNTTAKLCGDASDSELAAMKQKQRAHHQQFGMDAASFDRGFAAGEGEVKQKWQTLSPAQRTQTCAEVKQQMEELGKQLGEMYGQ